VCTRSWVDLWLFCCGIRRARLGRRGWHGLITKEVESLQPGGTADGYKIFSSYRFCFNNMTNVRDVLFSKTQTSQNLTRNADLFYCIKSPSFRMAGDCCRADGIQPGLYIDAYARIHTCMTIYMALWP